MHECGLCNDCVVVVVVSVALLLIVGLQVYVFGWGSDRVADLCGDTAGPYVIGDCSIGETT